MNDVVGGAMRVLKASKTSLVDTARIISASVKGSYGKGLVNKAQLLGAGIGAAYGAGTADYRYGYGDAVTRGLTFGALGGVAGTGHRLYKSGAFNKAARVSMGAAFRGMGENFMLNTHAWTDRDLTASRLWAQRRAARQPAAAAAGASSRSRKGNFLNPGSIFA